MVAVKGLDKNKFKEAKRNYQSEQEQGSWEDVNSDSLG